jgi:hypothetical protein
MNYEQSKSPEFGVTYQAIFNFENTLARELTPILAKDYVKSLISKLGGLNQELSKLIKKGEKLHYDVGHDLYGGLVSELVSDIYTNEQVIRYRGPIYFALRDGAPFFEAAKIIMHGSIFPIDIYLNRPLLGIDDEISPENTTTDGLMQKYLNKKEFLYQNPHILIDTGAWGTVIKALKDTYLKEIKLEPIFWYSHNPNIFGFINDQLKKFGLPEIYGEIFNDSLECVFPQQYKRPTYKNLYLGPNGVDINLEPSDILSVYWGKAALQGVSDKAGEFLKSFNQYSAADDIKQLVKLSQLSKSTGIWTGVLPTNTPTWSKGQEFLVNWPNNLLP